MPALTPAECDFQVAAAVNAGDLDAAVALYEPEAALLPEPGKAAVGLLEIREVLIPFAAMKATLTIEVPLVVEAAGTAVLHSRWAMKGTDASGNPVDIEGNGVEIVRRQADGTWKFIIDNPWGAP